MRLEQFEQFRALGNLRHFRQAAEFCNLSTSALTRSIQTIEQEFDCELVVRSTRSVTLTEAGEKFLVYCSQTLDDYDKFKLDLAKLNKKSSSKIIIGYTLDAASIVPHACGEFMQRYPDIRIEMQLKEQDILLDKMTSNEIDLIICQENVDSQHENTVYLPDQLILFVYKDHPLAFEQFIEKSHLEPYPILACFSQNNQVQKMLQDTVSSLSKLNSMKVGTLEQITQSIRHSNNIALAGIEHTKIVENNSDLIFIKPERSKLKKQLVIKTGKDINSEITQLLEFIVDEANAQSEVCLYNI